MIDRKNMDSKELVHLHLMDRGTVIGARGPDWYWRKLISIILHFSGLRHIPRREEKQEISFTISGR